MKVGNGHVGGNSDDFRPRRHDFAHRFVAELHHRLNQVAVAFFQNAFFLARFNQGVHGFGRMFGFLLCVCSLVSDATESAKPRIIVTGIAT